MYADLVICNSLRPLLLFRYCSVHQLEMKQQIDTCNKCRLTVLETCIVFYISIIFPVVSVNYIIGNSYGYEFHTLKTINRILGSIQIDIVTCYFILKGIQAFHIVEHVYAVSTLNDASNNTIQDISKQDVYDTANTIPEEDNVTITMDNSLTHNVEIEPSDSASNNLAAVFLPETNLALLKRKHIIFSLKTFLPYIFISSLAFSILQLIFYRNCINSWIVNVSGPFLVSPFLNFNRGYNTYKYINEVIWIPQNVCIFYIFLFNLYDSSLHFVKHVRIFFFVMISMWLSTFLQLYVVFKTPSLTNITVRSALTNMAFFLVGLCISTILKEGQRNANVSGELTVRFYCIRICNTIGTFGILLISGLIFCMYLQHAYSTPDTMFCHTTFSGNACLWSFDICNGRLVPFFAILLLSQLETPDKLLHIPQIFDSGLIQTASVWIQNTLYDCNLCFMSLGGLFAFIIHGLMVFLLQSWIINFTHFVIPLEIGIVTICCFYVKKTEDTTLNVIKSCIDFLILKIENFKIM